MRISVISHRLCFFCCMFPKGLRPRRCPCVPPPWGGVGTSERARGCVLAQRRVYRHVVATVIRNGTVRSSWTMALPLRPLTRDGSDKAVACHPAQAVLVAHDEAGLGGGGDDGERRGSAVSGQQCGPGQLGAARRKCHSQPFPGPTPRGHPPALRAVPQLPPLAAPLSPSTPPTLDTLVSRHTCMRQGLAVS